MIDKLIKLTSIIGTFLILNGIIYLHIFYHEFSINIFSYLEFTEVLTAFLNYAPNILMFFGVYLIHLFFPFLLIDKFVKWFRKKYPNFLANDTNKKRISKGLNIGFFIQVILFISCIILMKIDYWQISKALIYVTAFFGLNIIQRLVDFFENNIKEIIKIEYYDTFYTFIVFAFPFTVFTIWFSCFDSMQTKANPQNVNIFDNSGKSIQIDCGFKCVGKTNNYIFLYNKYSDKSMSISLKDVRTIQYY